MLFLFNTIAFQLCFTIHCQEGKRKLERTGIQLLFYADNINVLGKNINTIKKNTETPLQLSKEVGLEVNTEETKYMVMSCH
jgi:hypothetical protein